MIRLRSDCLEFEMSNGEKIPCSATSVTVELMGSAADLLDRHIVENAAAAVLHYFLHDLQKTSVTLSEFTQALEAALRGMGLNVSCDAPKNAVCMREADLRALACESGKAFELGFFVRLREELRRGIEHSPNVLRFSGLRGCVKQLAGARRWCPRCQKLSDHIVEYLRECLSREQPDEPCGLMVI